MIAKQPKISYQKHARQGVATAVNVQSEQQQVGRQQGPPDTAVGRDAKVLHNRVLINQTKQTRVERKKN